MLCALTTVVLAASAADPLNAISREGLRAVAFADVVVAVPAAGDPERRAEIVYERYVAARRIVAGRLALPEARDVTLVECATKSRFRRIIERLAGRSPPRYAVAVALPALATIVVDRTSWRPLSGPQPVATLAHEIAHLVLHRAFPRIPRWLDEGIAMWAADQRVDPHEEQTLRYWAYRRGTIAFPDLVTSFPRGHRLAAFAYVQSFSVVCFLIERRGGSEAILKLLALTQRQGFRSAWNAVYGEDPEATFEAWRRREARRFRPFRFLLYEIPAFFFPAALFLAAYLRYRLKRRRYFREEAEAEGDGFPAESPLAG
jgi:hypothetical protein